MNQQIKVPIREETRSTLAALAIHLDRKPDIPRDYAAHIDHLRIEMDRWSRTEDALRSVAADRLLEDALALIRETHDITPKEEK